MGMKPRPKKRAGDASDVTPIASLITDRVTHGVVRFDRMSSERILELLDHGIEELNERDHERYVLVDTRGF